MIKVIVSYKRADKVLTTKLLKTALICVPESQVEAYQKFNPEHEIIGHPDTVLGLSPKRQWIYEQFGDVFMIDDDALSFNRLYVKEKPYKLTPEEIDGLIDDTYELCRENGIKLFGFNSLKRTLLYNGSRPLSMTGFITGGAVGILHDNNLYFHDDSEYYGEDCFICALNGHFNRRCWIDNRFTTIFKTGGTGGTANVRNDEIRKKTLLHLKQMFGEAIVQDRYTNPKVGKYEKKFKSPY